MRLTLVIDAMHFEIDTRDPELLGKWVTEILERIPEWTPATHFALQAYPSLYYDPETRQWVSDWLNDSRIIGEQRRVNSPREWAKVLGMMAEEGSG
jgi:hypothetical protein